jgi:hypothetical protein
VELTSTDLVAIRIMELGLWSDTSENFS